MARQDGLIKLKGKMGGISFYKSQNGHLVRMKGGIDGSRIKNDPAFARTRENGSEFGRAGTSGKLLRTSLRNRVMNVSDNQMSNRLTRLLMKVIQSDMTNVRGQRNVIDGEATLLIGFEFNQHARLDKTFFGLFTPAINRVTGTLTIEVQEFVPSNMISYPAGATHFRLVSGAAEINFEAGTYVANTTESDDLPLSSIAQPGFTLTQMVTPASVSPLFLVFGIEFYQAVNGTLYPLRNGAFNALTIVAVDGGA